MPSYDTVREYFGDDVNANDSVIQQAPAWVICVIGLNHVLSFSRKDKASVAKTIEGGKSRIKLIIANDCSALTVTNTKTAHTKSMQATLRHSKVNYLQKIFPGDWILAWCVNNQEAKKDLLDRIKNGKACNKFTDGFKFLGRVDSFRKNMALAPGGEKSTSFSVTAYGFRELDTSLFYDLNLAENILQSNGGTAVWLAKIGLQVRDLFGDLKNGIAPNNCRILIASLLKILIGKGVPNANFNFSPLDAPTALGPVTEQQDTATKEASYAYLVPKEVGDLLGKKEDDSATFNGSGPSKQSGILSYADLLEIYTGVQKYENNKSQDPSVIFRPYIQSKDGFENFSGEENLGSFPCSFMDFTNRPIWSVLQQFQNPNVNELYTCLRVNPTGEVVPQVIFRQIPFTTPTLAKILGQEVYQVKTQNKDDDNESSSNKRPSDESDINSSSSSTTDSSSQNKYENIKVTPFHNLPRWVLHNAMIKSVSLGRSDATRINFVHIYGQTAFLGQGNVPLSYQMVNNPPIMDQLDIQRSGIRTYMSTVACFNLDQAGKSPTAWMELVADNVIGSQNTLNGTIECVGVVAPICEGDNVEWNGLLFHIESVTHSCSLSDSGEAQFSTTLTVTNGVLANDFDAEKDTDPNETFYPAIGKDPTLSMDPGITVETDFE